MPVLTSSTTAEILTEVPQPWLDYSLHQQDIWTKCFLHAHKVVDATSADRSEDWRGSSLFNRLVRMAFTRDERLMKLIEQYLEFTDLVDVGKRMIGTGLIGGKSVGMLLARAILKKKDERWAVRLEPHDSFFIGSDVFYTYLIQNRCWWIRRKLNDPNSGFVLDEDAERRLRTGRFPKDIEAQFIKMLEYFGQSPIIVRSSSLLEDAMGTPSLGSTRASSAPTRTPGGWRSSSTPCAGCTPARSTRRWPTAPTGPAGPRRADGHPGPARSVCLRGPVLPQIAGVGTPSTLRLEQRDRSEAGMLRLVFGLGRAWSASMTSHRIVALNTAAPAEATPGRGVLPEEGGHTGPGV